MKSSDMWFKISISLALLFIFLLPIIKGLPKNYAVYIHALEALAYLELTTIQNFVNDPATTKSHPAIKDIKKYLNEFTWNNRLVVRGGVNWTDPWMKLQAEKMSNNPIASYSLISRTNKYWPRIFNHSGQVRIRNVTEEELVGNVTIDNTHWPNDDDVEEAMEGITTTVFTYELNVSEMAVGKIQGISTGFRLTSDQCAGLSWWAHKVHYVSLAVEWLDEAITAKKIQDPKKSTDKLEKKRRRYLRKHDEDMEMYSLDNTPQFFEESASYYEMCRDPNNINSLISSCPPRKRTSFECELAHTRANLGRQSLSYCYFATICSGRNYHTEEQNSKLFCWFESNNPYLRIGPMKMEFLSLKPDIVQIYNVIGDQMINKLLTHATKRFRRALTGGLTDINRTEHALKEVQEGTKSNRSVYFKMGRYAMTGWTLEQNETFGMITIPKTIQSITGLDVLKPNSSEKLQVASYTFSGYYFGHDDASGNGTFPKSPLMGDRLATFMYYLSDVELGGHTAFLAAGVGARPVKGSAVFWYNIYGNASNDGNMMHAACPVMIGRKFVANSWIHATNQFQHRPCLLNRNEPFRILVNGKTPPYNK